MPTLKQKKDAAMWRNQLYLEWKSRERIIIGNCTDLSSFKDLPRIEQSVRLLKRLAFLFGKRTFNPHKPVDIWGHTLLRGLADGFRDEMQDAEAYLLTYPWSEIVRAGYVAEAPPGSGMYEITAEGWVVESKPVEIDDDYINTILP